MEHVYRTDHQRLVKCVVDYKLVGRRSVGRPLEEMVTVKTEQALSLRSEVMTKTTKIVTWETYSVEYVGFLVALQLAHRYKTRRCGFKCIFIITVRALKWRNNILGRKILTTYNISTHLLKEN